ncbi:MAG: hypothetical protein A2W10_10030 [Deltaproteobacteria bacterium RBG_16_55_12]|nr:MAG: hypothetical protein A2W10_10030 [Deltaproteobacteria bacterium RBG_16_55_12]
MFAYEDREVPEMKRVVVAPKGARLKSADVGVDRYTAGPDRWNWQPGVDGAAALKAEVHRLRSEESPPRRLRSKGSPEALTTTTERSYDEGPFGKSF